MFHLFTHAFFKALLVPGRRQRDARDGRRDRHAAVRRPAPSAAVHLPDLRRRRRWRSAGSSRFAGFFSKDEILLALKSASHSAEGQGWGWVYLLIYWVAVLTAFLTAFYTGRAFFMTFWGPEKLPSPDDPEAPPDGAGLRTRRP